MKRCLESKIIPALVFIFILSAAQNYLNAATSPPASVANNYQISHIISVSLKDEKQETRIKVAGNDRIFEYVTKTLDSPPRILVDIFAAVPSFETMTIPIKSRNLSSMRVGHHPKSIRLVLDTKGDDIPCFAVSSDRGGLTIFIKSKGRSIHTGRAKEEILGSEKSAPVLGEPNAEETTLSEPETKNLRKYPINKRDPIADRQQVEDPEKKLTQMEVDDGQDDTALFLEGLNAYREQNLSGTIEKLNHFIKIYPSGRYTERACFLLAKSYEQLYSDSIPTHFNDITNHYKDAVNRFPKSTYVPGAMLAVGNLHFKTKCYTEALGYYNFVSKKDKNTLYAMSAMIQKARILHLKKRMREALSVLKEVVSRDADIRQRTEAKIEMSKILYEMNAFHESLDVLSELRTTNPQSIYQYPEISLSLGNIYYQLGDNASVRENLFRFYNSCPDREMSHLILTRIGDTYQDDGLIKDAVKIYQMVCERYPDTEGARISIIRLAEQQEEWNLKTESILENIIELSPVKIGKDIDKPEEIYKNIINNPSDKDKKDSLAQLALFKLAVLYQKQKDYNKSLETLKKFFKRYPRTSLKKEYKYILQNTMELILKKDMERKKYANIINIYEREKELFSKIDSPEPFLMIAKACIYLNLENMATEMFSIADPLLLDKEKPPELLFFLSRSLSEKEKLKSALTRLNLLINNYPSDKYAQYAYRLKGSIFLRQKRYVRAAEMFSSALKYPLTPCKRTILLTDKAGALARCSFNEKALEAVREADSLKEACDSVHDYIYQEIGDVYLNLGYPKEAAAIFNQAIEMAKDKANRIPLKFKVAQCYWLLNKRKDSLALYDQISSFDDPFWSNLAKERIEELNFNREIRGRRHAAQAPALRVRGQRSEVRGRRSENQQPATSNE